MAHTCPDCGENCSCMAGGITERDCVCCDDFIDDDEDFTDDEDELDEEFL